MADHPLSAVVLAAGEGTRMHSTRPKPLHRLCGRPMILHVLDALAELPVEKVVVVVGHRAEWVTKTLVDHAPGSLSIEFVEQPEPLGTGDALAVGLTGLPESLADADGDVIVLPGDTPLVRSPTLASLVRHHRHTGAAATLLTARLEEPGGYDRVVRGKNDDVEYVAEASDVSGDLRHIDEVATPIHIFRHSVLAPALRRLRPTGVVGEHVLSGVYEVLHDAGYPVASLLVADSVEAAGVNDRAQLAVAESELRYRINERWMRRGVTMWDPEHTYVDASVRLERDVVLLPGVVLQGDCLLAGGAEVGPVSHLVDTFVGEGAIVTNTNAVRSEIGEHARVGPFVFLGPGTTIAAGAVVEPFTHVRGDDDVPPEGRG
ncbi:MAG TPA: NTP transferase domain-containing protein [Acidimicrobiales bacterium]|nr:NTP transferase domain-containing protein [Acidimicrobiales bacterium]